MLLYVCLFSGLGALGLAGPDEPRYAAIARAMAETHDWITPRLWGTPWFEKPVLYYWAAGVAMRIFGVSEFAARLPSALSALLAVVAVAWAALRSYGVRAACYSVVLLPTSVAMIGFARAASPDMLFAGLLTAAMAVASEMLQRRQPGTFLRVAFGFFLGAAVLAKGPAAVILAGGATLLWAAISRQWRAPFRFLHPLIIVAFCATALPWYILCAMRNPDFLRVFIWQHNFERYLTPVFEHRQPFWFFGEILILAVAPWTPVLAAETIEGWRFARRSEWRSSPGVFFLGWGLFPVLFFSLSQSKLPGYILPAIPPFFALLGRRVADFLAPGEKRTIGIWTIGCTGAIFAVTALATATRFVSIGRDLGVASSTAISFEMAMGIGGLVAIGLSVAGRARAGVIAMALLVTTLVGFTNLSLLPAADSRITPRRAAQDALRLVPPGQNVQVFGLTRSWNYGMDYYFGRELPEWMTGKPLPEWLMTPEADAPKISHVETAEEASSAGAPDAVLLHIIPAGSPPR